MGDHGLTQFAEFSCGHIGTQSPTQKPHVCYSKHIGYPCTPDEEKPSYRGFYRVCDACSPTSPKVAISIIDGRREYFNGCSFAGLKYDDYASSVSDLVHGRTSERPKLSPRFTEHYFHSSSKSKKETPSTVIQDREMMDASKKDAACKTIENKGQGSALLVPKTT